MEANAKEIKTEPIFALVDANNFYVSCERVFNHNLEGVPMVVLSTFTPNLEVYSVDESFLQIESVRMLYPSATAMGQQIRERMRRVAVRLNDMGIFTVLDLRNAKPAEIRKHFNVVLERACLELRGVPCLELEEVVPDKQQIMSSKSFGQPVTEVADLCEAISAYVERAAQKLRSQHSLAGGLYVFLRTNPFDPKAAQYSANQHVSFGVPTDDTRLISELAVQVIKQLFKPGFVYKKAGVMLTGLTEKRSYQHDLFADVEVQSKSTKLMRALDEINLRFGRDSLICASSGFDRVWAMKCSNRSPKYTTAWVDLPSVL